MKLRIMSDLHREFFPFTPAQVLKAQDPDEVLILAGDACTVSAWKREPVVSFFRELFESYPKVFYVPGNHEYYKSGTFREVARFMDTLEAQYKNLTVLDSHRGVVEHGGVRFFGDTMWWGREADKIPADRRAMNDEECIRDLYRWVFDRHDLFRKKMGEFKVGDVDVVVTHYLPSANSISPQYRGSELNKFFMSDCDGLIDQVQPKVWVHGHTHDSCDYRHVAGTRIVCNPHGYRQENASGFEYRKVVEV